MVLGRHSKNAKCYSFAVLFPAYIVQQMTQITTALHRVCRNVVEDRERRHKDFYLMRNSPIMWRTLNTSRKGLHSVDFSMEHSGFLFVIPPSGLVLKIILY